MYSEKARRSKRRKKNLKHRTRGPLARRRYWENRNTKHNDAVVIERILARCCPFCMENKSNCDCKNDDEIYIL